METMDRVDPPIAAPRRDWTATLAACLALVGGLLISLAAVMVTVSVVGRWLFNAPVPADYELVEVAVGVAVFAFLGQTQIRNGHIAVDTFTLSLPPRVNDVIDGVWTLVLAAFLAFFTWGLFSGGLDARDNGATLIQLPWPIWPVYLVCAALAACACLITIVVAFGKFRGPR